MIYMGGFIWASSLCLLSTFSGVDFELIAAVTVSDPRLNNIPSFDIEDKVLRIPQLNVGGILYAVQFGLLSSNSSVEFRLLDYKEL